MSTRICSQCATATDEDDLRFCTSCGSPLPEASVDAPKVPGVSASSAAQPAPQDAPAAPATAYVAPVVLVPAYAAPSSSDNSEVSIIRRTAARVFLPPRLETEEDTPMVSRAWLGQGAARGKKQIGGQRKAAGDLPDWEPAPPGELVVSRRKRK